MSYIKLLTPLGNLYSYLYYKRDRLRLKKVMNNGLKVGKNVYIMEDVLFDSEYPFLIEIGDNCRISREVRILAHDATTFRDLGITRIAPVKILEGTFIGERVIILPGVTIGPRALIAAGSIVNRDIGEDMAVAGNPARPYAKFSEILNKYHEMVKGYSVFKKEEIESGKITRFNILDEINKRTLAFIRGVPKEDPYYVNANMDEIRQNALNLFKSVTS